MPAVAGLRSTATNDWATDERPKNFREMILWRDPNGMAPLTALMSRMGESSTDDPEFAWYEEELRPIRLQVSAALATTGQTSLTIITANTETALDVVAGDLLMVEKAAATSFSYEIVEVSTSPSASDTLVVTRGSAGTTAATIATSSYLLKIGNAFEEGSGGPKAVSRKPTKVYNYTQIFKTSYNLTNTANATHFRTGDALKNDKKRKMFDHSVALEQAFLFGSRYETTGSNSKPKRYTGGLMYFLADAYNATDKPIIQTISSALTTAGTNTFLDATYKMFDYGYTGAGNERIVLAGNGFLNYLNKWVKADAATRMNQDGGVKVFGMELAKWTIPQGTFYIRTHPLMNVNSRYTNGAFFINPSAIRYRPLAGRDTKFLDNTQLPDEDQKEGMWLTEAGVEFNHLRSMAYIAVE